MDEVAKATRASRESKSIEFKPAFDIRSEADWCEIVRDVIAMANSGGGAIVIGVDRKGQPLQGAFRVAGFDVADLAARIHDYTGTDFIGFEIVLTEKDGSPVAVITVDPSEHPIAFSKAGPCADPGDQTVPIFSAGRVYFRHGARSEPASTEDLRRFVERRLAAQRREMLRDVRKVVSGRDGRSVAPASEVRVTANPAAAGIRIVDDPDAPAYRQIDPNETHPFRQKHVIAEIRKSLPGGEHFSSRDALAVRRLHDIDSNPAFFYHPKFGSPQYSPAYIDWLRERVTDPAFLPEVRRRWNERLEGLRGGTEE